MTQTADQLAAQLYDQSMTDWPGEVDFYARLCSAAAERGGKVLDVACGTGRLALRLASPRLEMTALDSSAEMLSIARAKAGHLPGLRWVQADMRSFDLGQTFALAFVAAHSFQFLLTPEDQMDCLACLRRHLDPGAILVIHLDHQDPHWLADVVEGRGDPAPLMLELAPGRRIRASRAWTLERATQTAFVTTRWEELDGSGGVIQTWTRGPIALHCLFRYEMEHLLARAGFRLQALYGDFTGGALEDSSTEMIFLAQRHRDPG
ncbi:MAG TPA: class I SAM-dependent methyltransferase [Anaerolineales bacterium]|nr:class I SAM-dependent methyltransferase [Anaerolineales bacterium]